MRARNLLTRGRGKQWLGTFRAVGSNHATHVRAQGPLKQAPAISPYVSISQVGPQGGYYGFLTFHRGMGVEQLDLFIDMLTEARERAFGPRET